MDDTTAPVSQKQYDENQQISGPQATSQGQQSQSVADSHVQQPVSNAPHKEHAPLSEHMQITDPLESQPELHQELKEAGMDVKQDEARLHLTREHQAMGVTHSPASSPVSSHLQDAKQEFPMDYTQAEEQSKKGSVWNSIRWLATLVVKQMKTKNAAEK